MRFQPPPTPPAMRMAIALAAAVAGFWPSVAKASFLPPEMMDAMATYVAWFVIIVIPVGAIVLFWMVHVLPEKIAEKRHHPQKDAIHTLCLLSLVFGGLLWPLAWLWAYVKPVGHQMAYGTDKHEDYFHEMGEKARTGKLSELDLAHLRAELEALSGKGTLTPGLKALYSELAARATTPAAANKENA